MTPATPGGASIARSSTGVSTLRSRNDPAAPRAVRPPYPLSPVDTAAALAPNLSLDEPPAVILRSRRDDASGRWFGLSMVLAAHLLVVYFVLQYEPARQALSAVAPIMVDLITPPKVIPPPPPPPPPPRQIVKPRLEPMKPIAAAPLIAAETPAPVASFVAPPVEPAPPAPATEVAVAGPIAPPAPPAPPPITPPSFNAAYLHNQPPSYPALSRRMAEQGRVLLRVLVSSSGQPEKVEVRTSSGFERLDLAALDAVRTWKFVPAQQAGNAVAAWVQVPLVFSLSR